MGVDSKTWSKAVENDLGRLANGIENMVRANNTIEFTRKEEITKGRTVTYTNFVCDYLPLKSEYYRTRLTVGGDRLDYRNDA